LSFGTYRTKATINTFLESDIIEFGLTGHNLAVLAVPHVNIIIYIVMGIKLHARQFTFSQVTKNTSSKVCFYFNLVEFKEGMEKCILNVYLCKKK
jgi:hypothetical protein